MKNLANNLTKNEKKVLKDILIKAICNEQLDLITNDPEAYTSKRYKVMEGLKTKIKMLQV